MIMSLTVPGAHKRAESAKRSSARGVPARSGAARMVMATARSESGDGAEHSYVDLGDSARVALMISPQGRGPFAEQVQEVLSRLVHVLEKQPEPMAITVQTVFLRDAANQQECARMLGDFYGAKQPVTNFVLQPPCDGAALALEAWAIGGKSVRVEHFGPHVLTVSYDSVRWVYCAGVRPGDPGRDIYSQTMDALGRMRVCLVEAGSGLEQVVRTWFYLGGITERKGDRQRYQELNRARTDFYHDIRFQCSLLDPSAPRGVYPASTGIGMAGTGLVLSCLGLETRRDDVFLLPLENPQQTPAYAYHPKYSPQSPKFSRAVALVLGDYVTTWISGTASIVNSETLYVGNLEKQTEQTIDNIERLIAPENFTLHGVKGAGARLHDLAKIRVYLKRAEDLAKCRAVCERRFGPVPVIYAVADVCRPELLVEIEGVAFSRYSRGQAPQP
jgi:enamine deaminase RidA (YjgF/YER057c/UK114 family)